MQCRGEGGVGVVGEGEDEVGGGLNTVGTRQSRMGAAKAPILLFGHMWARLYNCRKEGGGGNVTSNSHSSMITFKITSALIFSTPT